MSDFLTAPVPHEEAARIVAEKVPLLREAFERLLPELRARAFAISLIEDANVLQAVRDAIADLPRGADWRSVKAEVIEKISPWFNEKAAQARSELLMRLHAFQAYAAAQYEALQSPEARAAFPYLQYVAVGDEATRDSHRALDGLILPREHPFWEDHYPPWEYNCRCMVVPVSEEEFEEARGRRAGDPSGWVPSAEVERRMTDPQIRTLDLGDGHPADVRTPADRAAARNEDPAKAYRWHPGDLRIPLETLRDKYDAAVWAQFEAAARAIKLESGRTLWEWLGGSPIILPGSPVLRGDARRRTTWRGVVAAQGLSGKSVWTKQEIAGIVRALNKRHGITVSRLKIAVASPLDSGPFSARALSGYANRMLSMLPADVLKKIKAFSIQAVNDDIGALADYNPTTREIRICIPQIRALGGKVRAAEVQERVFHEMGHWLYHEGPSWYRRGCDRLFRYRTRDEKAVESTYGVLVYRDRWYDEYAGKINGREAITRHLQLLANPNKMATLMKSPNGETIAENLRIFGRIFRGG